MSIFQVFSTLFGLFMLYIVEIHRKKQVLAPFEAWIWKALWIGFILLSIFPNVLLGITGFLHFARVFDLLIVVAFMILTTIMINIYFAQKELQQSLEKMLRMTAITNVRKKRAR